MYFMIFQYFIFELIIGVFVQYPDTNSKHTYHVTLLIIPKHLFSNSFSAMACKNK